MVRQGTVAPTSHQSDNVVTGRQGQRPRRPARLRRVAALTASAGLIAVGGVTAAQASTHSSMPGAAADQLVSDPAALVDPMIGTGDGGQTVGQVDMFPGATAPFGMLTFSPDTPSRPDGGGYYYPDSSTMGFALTHMSGPGCGAMGDFPILPTTGAIGSDPVNSTQPFNHTDEHARPGSYSVTLDPSTPTVIQADLAATARTGIGTFTYPSGTQSNMLFKMGDAQSGNTSADVQVVNDHEVSGEETAGQFCGSPGTYPVHFVADFSRPFTSFGTWHTAPTGANVFTQPTGQLPWSYHYINGGGSTPTIKPTTTSAGASAISWQQSNALPQTWIQATPPALTQGKSYEASITVQGTGDVFLDFYNGQVDVDSQPVQLTGTPVTLTVDAAVPTGGVGAQQVQVRTANAGPVNLVASAISLRQESVVTTPGAAKASSRGLAGTAAVTSRGEAKGAQPRAGIASTSGLQSGAWVTFDTTTQRQVTMKVSVSYVSEANAAANIAAEDRGWSVRAVAARTYAQWDQLLRRIRIGGGTPAQRTEFYSALYHALLEPNIFSDANGDYIGFDNKVHRTPRGTVQYANYSGWDVYRDEIPLLALLVPHQTGDMMTSLLNDQAQGGWLPKWGFANTYTDVMNGDAADPILAEAYAFGVRNFDANAALAAMLKGATQTPTSPSQLGQGWYVERPQLAQYEQLGYVQNTQQSSLSPEPNGASETLEYAIADFSIAELAKSLGQHATYSTFLHRSQDWSNIFNTATGYIEPRDGSGQFPEFGPTTDGMGAFGQSGFQEGNAAQYTWSVPQDFAGLIAGMGGDQAAIARLDNFFTQLNAGPNQPYEWAGNEPSLSTPWVYDYAGAPYKTQAIVHELLGQAYSDTPGGEPGNDDLGAMSSWYVWASMGIYPETPGAPVLVLGAPIFSSVRIDVPHGARADISAPGASLSSYIQGLTVNGRPSSRTWVPSELLTDARGRGARLGFTLGGSADTTWGAAAADAPPSYPSGTVSFPPGRKPAILVPTGPNLLGSTPTGQLNWQGPVQNGVGAVPGTVVAATTPQGTSAVHWTQANAAPNTWIWVDPPAALPAGQYYQYSVTLQGTGDVYLDFWNGSQDLSSSDVQLTGTPVTLTVQGQVPSAGSTHFQIRTAGSGAVDLMASAATVQTLTPEVPN
jgi:predicted alpha-1,2-mannosidase